MSSSYANCMEQLVEQQLTSSSCYNGLVLSQSVSILGTSNYTDLDEKFGSQFMKVDVYTLECTE